MGAYTWTFVRIDKVNKEQVKSLIEKAICSSQNTRYGTYSKMKEEEYIQKWIDFHNKNYNYFVNECGVDPSKMTNEYLIKDIRNKMKRWHYRQKCYQKVLNDEMTFEDMLHKTHQLRGYNDFCVIKHKGYHYVNLKSEIFRNYEYYDGQFDTVEDLIMHLEQPNMQIMDFDRKDFNYNELTPELRQKIIDYYSAIGDGNFVVHFG